MSAPGMVFLFALRVDRSSPAPNWWTLWFDEDDRKLLVRDERIVWCGTEDGARDLAEDGRLLLSDEPPGVLDLPQLLEDIATPTPGVEGRLSSELTLLDDLRLAVDSIHGSPVQRFGDASGQLVSDAFMRLMHGADCPTTIAAAGGSHALATAAFEILGRVFLCSAFVG